MGFKIVFLSFTLFMFIYFGVRVGNDAVNAAAAAIPLESQKMLLKGMSYTELEVCI